MHLRPSPLAALSSWTDSIAERSTDNVDAENRRESPKLLQSSGLRKFTRMIELGMVVDTTRPVSINAVKLAWKFAKTRGSPVYLAIGNGEIGIVIADVSGHGVGD